MMFRIIWFNRLEITLSSIYDIYDIYFIVHEKNGR